MAKPPKKNKADNQKPEIIDETTADVEMDDDVQNDDASSHDDYETNIDDDTQTYDDGEVKMSLVAHLTELRNRLGIAIAAFIILFLICVAPIPGTDNSSIAYHVFIFLQAPLADVMEARGGGRMIFTALHEGFFTQIKVGFFTALCVTFPIMSMQIWRFIAPGLYKNEKQAFLPFLIATPVLFLMGAAMVYYVVTPLAWNFFISFEMAASEGALAIEVEPRISEYLSLVMRLIFAFGLAFELPVVLLLLARAGLVTPEGLAEKRKIAIVIAFVAAAILTPPDIISQVLLATPIIILYELSIFGAKIMNKRQYDEFDD
ncbi:twin-arginine translocase subunit TatC [Candidatus Puniceispirillum marinum]|uniref:Sec-independent protein translocase protein TatC n=1 Tax=Puniceispirillum marinum (strain IMCC1322) TaxID=488538 RepID=D5BQU2_PUNMI|nr:twin-arginine translocase subunit TatC [Candidatus Puniceispirillum marinum]ADE38656.1 Sec-independent periplasmic protein translocase [Candidatus Puniceispirillum marinum IMCC1322]